MNIRKVKKNEGITLIALVITIIVLLILAGVTIVSLNGDNSIIEQANNAKTQTRVSQIEEALEIWNVKKEAGTTSKTLDQFLDDLIKQDLISENEKETIISTGKIIIGNKPIYITGAPKVGDYVIYNPDEIPSNDITNEVASMINVDFSHSNIYQDTHLSWRVLELDNNGNISKIISDSTTESIYLYDGNKVYNNGVYVLNKICEKQYSSNIGIAKNLSREDIEKCFNQKGIEKRNNYTNSYTGNKYGDTLNFTNNISFPTIATYEKDIGINTADIKKDGLKANEQNELYENIENIADNITMINNGYMLYDSNNYKDNIYYELFHDGIDTCWLSTRIHTDGSYGANLFTIGTCGKDGLSYQVSSVAGGSFGYGRYGLRPVVTIKDEYKTQFVKSDDNSQWKIQ